jgi:hypothetical protein
VHQQKLYVEIPSLTCVARQGCIYPAGSVVNKMLKRAKADAVALSRVTLSKASSCDTGKWALKRIRETRLLQRDKGNSGTRYKQAFCFSKEGVSAYSPFFNPLNPNGYHIYCFLEH